MKHTDQAVLTVFAFAPFSGVYPAMLREFPHLRRASARRALHEALGRKGLPHHTHADMRRSQRELFKRFTMPEELT